MRKQEMRLFLHRLVATGTESRDKMQTTHEIVSQNVRGMREEVRWKHLL